MWFYARHKIAGKFRKFYHGAVNWRHNDDDILSAKQKEVFDSLLAEGSTLRRAAPERQLAFQAHFEQKIATVIPPKRFRNLREWLDIIAVAMAVAFGVRGLFLQPFKIPTSSMQPTLYGIHYMERENSSNKMLGKLPRPLDWMLFSTRPAQLIFREDGAIDGTSLRVKSNLLFDGVTFRQGNSEYYLPGQPAKVVDYAGIEPERIYRRGEKLCDGFLSTGDHLFVERVSPNLFGMKRGDVVVFNTAGIESPDGKKLMDMSGFYYIKRLAGLPGDTLRISDGQLWVKPKDAKEFKKIQSIAPEFAKVYSNKGGYQGHSNAPGGAYGFHLNTGSDTFTVPEDSYFVLGDNTRYSADSRIWGIVPRKNITGKAFLVFWPFSRRWGIADRQDALDVPTGKPVRNTFPSMGLQ